MGGRPKILFVTCIWPLPATTGGHQRALNIGRLLRRVGDVSIAFIQVGAGDEESDRLTRREFDVRMVLQASPVNLDSPLDRFRHRWRQEFEPSYLAADGYSLGDGDRAALLELADKYDAVWIYHIMTANFCRIEKWPRSVLDIPDVPSGFYFSRVHSGSNSIRRILDLRMAWIWQRREKLLRKRFDVLTVCSEDERRYLSDGTKVYVIPNGSNLQSGLRRPSPEFPRIGFIGAFAYGANKEGVEWFAQHVWPMVKREVPRVVLRLVGRGSENCSAAFGPDVEGLGWMDDPAEEIATWSAMIIPIRFGGGTRIKMADGFARKCPIVATTTGAFGYDVRNGEEFLLADEAQDFASACIRLLRNPELGKTIAGQAHERFLREWSWDSFEGKVREVVQECLVRGGSMRADGQALRESLASEFTL